MTSKSWADMRCGMLCQVAKCALGENGRPDDSQDDVGWQQSRVVMWPSGQSLHAYALYWAIGFSSKGLLPQLTYIAIVDVGLALFQDSHYYGAGNNWEFLGETRARTFTNFDVGTVYFKHNMGVQVSRICTIFYGESVLEIFASFDLDKHVRMFDTYVITVKLAKIFRTLST